MRWNLKGTVGAICGLLLLAAVPAFAHHSPAAEFQFHNTVTLKGTITRVDWINPHAYVRMDVKDDGGKVTSWSLETLPTGWLHRAGLTKEALQGADGAGQSVTVEVFPAKDGTKNLAWIQKITYPDGHFFVLWNAADDPNSNVK